MFIFQEWLRGGVKTAVLPLAPPLGLVRLAGGIIYNYNDMFDNTIAIN
jgi:hypothetical protein